MAAESGRTRGRPTFYQITVRGKVDPRWSDWFGRFELVPESTPDGSLVTTLTGPVADQAELRGILVRLWDLNLTVISVSAMYVASDPQGDEGR